MHFWKARKDIELPDEIAALRIGGMIGEYIGKALSPDSFLIYFGESVGAIEIKTIYLQRVNTEGLMTPIGRSKLPPSYQFKEGDRVHVEYLSDKWDGEIVGPGYTEEQWRVMRPGKDRPEIINECFITPIRTGGY